MKKLLLILAIAAGTHFTTYAQNNANEAKAAYLLAEESYSKGDYKTALDYLQQVKTALGSANCKILYLQIIITKEVNAKNPRASEVLLPLIAEFEQSPDFKDYNEEKILEITKIKMAMKNEQKALKEKDDREKAIKDSAALADKTLNAALDKIFNRYPPFDLTPDQLDAARPELNVKKWKPTKKYPGVVGPDFIDYNFEREGYPFGELDKGTDFKNQLVAVQYFPLTAKKTYSFTSILVYTDKGVNPEGATTALAEADAIIERYHKELGPTLAAPSKFKQSGADVTVYSWYTKERQVQLCKRYYPGRQPTVKLFEEVRKIGK